MVLSMIFGTQLLTENSNRVDECLFVDLSCKGLPRSFKVDKITLKAAVSGLFNI